VIFIFQAPFRFRYVRAERSTGGRAARSGVTWAKAASGKQGWRRRRFRGSKVWRPSACGV